MTALINLVISVVNNLIVAFDSMNIVPNLSFNALLFISLIILAIIDVVWRLAR